MYQKRIRIGELMVAHRLITREQLEHALEQQKLYPRPLGQVLIDQRLISEEQLLTVCALQKGVSAWHLQNQPPAPEALELIPAHICNQHSIIPAAIKAGRLLLCMVDTDNVDVVDMVRNLTRMRVEPVLATEDRIRQVLEQMRGNNSVALQRLVTDAIGNMQGEAEQSSRQENLRREAEAGPVVNIVNQILLDAVRIHASDIHIEPRKNSVEVRFRVDGDLRVVHTIPGLLQNGLIARMKIMAELDIVEYRVPQDGRLSVVVDGREIDMRVSVLPSHNGQRIVLRILDKTATLRTLDQLGFAPSNMRLFSDMIRKPHGIILVTGPTGSGKTTTLYASINALKSQTTNIMTCEDPVEYEIAGINQCQVNDKAGLTFAAQLRAILRQDPDIVLVGEIRDQETAQTAIRAALTGHLVLSTLHCNDAASAIPRLLDVGMEPYLLSTALIGVTAQRLLRVLCPHCKKQVEATREENALLKSICGKGSDTLWRPTGCERCFNLGFRGRQGVHEVMPISTEMQSAIASRESVSTLKEIASKFGYRSIQADACKRAIAGQTTIQEVQRLIYLDTFTPFEEDELPVVPELPQLRVA